MQARQKGKENNSKVEQRDDRQCLFPFYQYPSLASETERSYMFDSVASTPDDCLHSALATLINRLDSPVLSNTNVIEWGSPVPSFGDLSRSVVATLGINPSNREFVDEKGMELDGKSRRFHTLKSLGIPSWSETDARHLRLILESCSRYFLNNPYDRWFKRLDDVISGANASFYNPACQACHLDLIPYATACKWTELTKHERSSLLTLAADSLGILLRNSPVRLIILNGKSVVERFQDIAGISLEKRLISDWSLPRKSKSHVKGYAYVGAVKSLSGIQLSQEILVLGYNHNLQSSFGVTAEVIGAIQRWISQMTAGINNETKRQKHSAEA